MSLFVSHFATQPSLHFLETFKRCIHLSMKPVMHAGEEENLQFPMVWES